ncbi:hypothetical protein Tco_1271352, partial [Tanacetum coccineum]
VIVGSVVLQVIEAVTDAEKYTSVCDAEYIGILDADIIMGGPIKPWEFKAARGRPVSVVIIGSVVLQVIEVVTEAKKYTRYDLHTRGSVKIVKNKEGKNLALALECSFNPYFNNLAKVENGFLLHRCVLHGALLLLTVIDLSWMGSNISENLTSNEVIPKAYQEVHATWLYNIAMAIVDYRGHRIITQGDKSNSYMLLLTVAKRFARIKISMPRGFSAKKDQMFLGILLKGRTVVSLDLRMPG